MQDIAAKKAIIMAMMEAFPSSRGQVVSATVDAYARAVDDCSVEAVSRACDAMARGTVDRDRGFLPTAGELAELARKFQAVIDAANAPAPNSEHGMVEVDFGHGKIDLRDKTAAEVEVIFKLKRLPRDGELAQLPPPETPESRAEAAARHMARLQTMSDA